MLPNKKNHLKNIQILRISYKIDVGVALPP